MCLQTTYSMRVSKCCHLCSEERNVINSALYLSLEHEGETLLLLVSLQSDKLNTRQLLEQ